MEARLSNREVFYFDRTLLILEEPDGALGDPQMVSTCQETRFARGCMEGVH